MATIPTISVFVNAVTAKQNMIICSANLQLYTIIITWYHLKLRVTNTYTDITQNADLLSEFSKAKGPKGN